MNINNIWWSRIDTSVNTIKNISSSLFEHNNILFNVENNLPWRDTFYDTVCKDLALMSASKSIEFIDYTCGDPGKIIFDRMCSPSIKAEYWPSITYAEFLSERKDIVLNNRVVWIKNIKKVSDIKKWMNFVTSYNKASIDKDHDFGLFVIECKLDNDISFDKNYFDEIKYSDTKLDKYILSMSKISELDCNFPTKQYIADLASIIGENDTELCGALSQLGVALAENPAIETFKVLETTRSDGTQFDKIDSDKLKSYILTAQIKNIFPELEKARIDFIEKHSSQLYQKLPITDSLSATIKEPIELEIGTLYSILSHNKCDFEASDFELVEKYRSFRNLLAHNDLLNWSEIKYVFSKD